MNADCRTIEPLLALCAKGELDAAQCEAVDAHLAACPKCRAEASAQREVRALLVARADNLRVCAPDTLRQCVGPQLLSKAHRATWSLWKVPAVAALLVTLVLLGAYGLTGASTTVLAAQLSLDHLKCSRRMASAAGNDLDAAAAAEAWRRDHQSPLDVPNVPRGQGARLLGVRRCLYGHGHLAHLLYTVNGRIVSLFVMPRDAHEASAETTHRAVFGHQARVWGAGSQTFALISDADAEAMHGLERLFRTAQ